MRTHEGQRRQVERHDRFDPVEEFEREVWPWHLEGVREAQVDLRGQQEEERGWQGK